MCYPQVNRAFRLSATAKSIYQVFKSFEKDGESFVPMEYMIALTGISERSIRTYTNELIEFGLIEKSKPKDRKNVYSIKELPSFFLFSERIHALIEKHTAFFGFTTCLQAGVKLSHLIPFDTFYIEINAQVLDDAFLELVKGKEVVPMFYPKNAKIPPTTPTQAFSSKPQTQKKDALVLGEWKPIHFLNYFYDMYFQKYNQRLVKNETIHKKMMKTFCEKFDSNQKIKEHIDAFFELEFDNHMLNYMVGHNMINHVQNYVLQGTMPYFLKKKKSKIEPIEDTEFVPTTNEDLANQMKLHWGEALDF